MKVVIAGLMHETNTYCAEPTGSDAFRVHRGAEAVAEYGEARIYPGGMLVAARDLGMDAALAFFAVAEPSGTIRASAYDAMKEDLLSSVKAELPADAIALALHGAGVVEGIDDLEGDLIREVRALVGPEVPIVVSLDLHGNITEAMAADAQILLGVHEYPHIDMYERGYEAVQLIPALLAGAKPVSHIERLPMLLPTTTTFGGAMGEINQLCQEMERRPKVMDVTLFHGFPYTDIPDVGVFAIATTDGDPALARACARELASVVWERREEFLQENLTPAQAIQRALAVEGNPVVINETSDNTGGGTPGDGTHLLRAMLEANLDKACFGFIVDPEVAAAAHAAGCGAEINIRLGGKTDRLHGDPIETRAYVKSLSDGRFVLTHFAAGLKFDLGKMCRLAIGGIDVIVGSVRSQTFDTELFILNGIDVGQFHIVALKSSQHFRAAFEPIARQIITADSPGLTSLRLETFDRKRAPGPMWPLDARAAYTPDA
ncbi:MAG: M81 family metallopeptidase [Candidatus Dormibacteria bacterium]